MNPEDELRRWLARTQSERSLLALLEPDTEAKGQEPDERPRLRHKLARVLHALAFRLEGTGGPFPAPNPRSSVAPRDLERGCVGSTF